MKDLRGINTLDYIESIDANTGEEYSEWQQARVGKFTSSRIGDLMVNGRGKDKFWGDTAMNYIYEKIAELLTGIPNQTPETRAMEWGNDNEGPAIKRYAEATGNPVEHLGKVFIEFNDMCGGSPDGFVGDDGILEIKCPYNSANHIKTYITGEVPKGHLFQCQANMLFSGRSWCDYVSFDPRMPEAIQLKIIRIKRDEEVCNQILERIELAAQEIVKIQEQTGITLKIQF